MGPVAMLRPPPGTSSQTQPDGRPVYSVFALRLGQRGIAPLGARPLDEPRRQARRPALQHPLDRVPLVPREPPVGPRDRPCGAALLLSGHAVLRSPGAGRSGPQGIGFPHSSAHVRMNVGGVRMKLIIKGQLVPAINYPWHTCAKACWCYTCNCCFRAGWNSPLAVNRAVPQGRRGAGEVPAAEPMSPRPVCALVRMPAELVRSQYQRLESG